jgi:WD40 repeat protein
VRLWDTVTGEARLTLTGHTDWVRAVAFSPDGAQLATGSSDGTARLWDSTQGVPTWIAATFRNNAAASWSTSDNRLCFATSDAWRYLRAVCFDSDGGVLGLQPYELYYGQPQRSKEGIGASDHP